MMAEMHDDVRWHDSVRWYNGAAMDPRVVNPRGDLLLDAERIVNGDRNVDYGDPIDDFRRTAAFWTEYLRGVRARRQTRGEVSNDELEPHDVANMMMLLKISRATWSPAKYDNLLDIAGYAACSWDCINRE